MSNTIKLKRGSGSDPSASDLVSGEVALRTDTGKLFTKKDNGNVAEIGGSGISDGDKGDITVSNSGDTFTIDNGVITSAKIADGAIALADMGAASVGTSQLVAGAVNNDKVASNAAIAGSKISPSFNSNITISTTVPTITFTDTDNNPDFTIKNDNGGLRFRDETNSASRLLINSDGHVDIFGNLDVGAGVDVTGAITSTGKVQAGDDVEVVVSSGDAFILTKGGTNQGHLVKKADNTTVAGLTNGGAVSGGVNDAAVFAPAGDLKLMAGGNNVNSNLIVDVTSSGIDVTGNITVSGTVDGVDIAARNTLFGGLTSSSGVLTNGVTATTQSASDNSTKVATTAYTDTAISNLVDSAPGTLNTLNELAAALGDDANFSTTVTNSIATKMPLAGGTFTGDVLFQCDSGNILFDKSDNSFKFSDSVKAKFGGDGDLVLHHSGSDSFIDEKGTGDLKIRTTNGNGIQLISGTSENMITCASDGSVELYEDGTKRIETTTSGANIVGNLTLSGTVDGRDVASDGSKLDGIAASATNNGSGNAITDGDKGDITVSNSGGTFIIDNDVVTTAKMINFPTQTILGRETAGTGNATTLNASQVRSILNVENGATADQSASEILTLIKTVDGAGSGLDADTLDGISSASFVRSDANDSITGHLTITNDSGLKVRSSTNGNGAVINFSDHAGGSYSQNGSLTYKHGDGEVTTTGGNSNDGWLFEGSETRTVVKVVGDLEATQDIYGGTLVLNDSDNQKIILQGSNDPYIRWREGTTNKAFIQWSSSGYLWLQNQEDNSVIVLRDNLGFSPDGGSTIHKIFHAGNDGSGSGLDADTLDGVQGSSYLRSDTDDTFSAVLTLSSTSRDCMNFSGGAGDDNRGIAFNGRIAVSADQNDGWLRLNNASEVGNGVYTPKKVRADGGFHVGGTTVIDTSGNIAYSRLTGTPTAGVPASGGTFTGDIAISGGAAALTVNANSDIRFTNGTWSGNATKIQHHSNYLYIVGGSNGIIFREGGDDRAIIDGSGHLRPGANNQYDLGTTSYKWKNIYTNDLNLSNEDSANDVDGTWGSYTIQEGENDLFLLNNRNGKMYKFMLQEVS